MFEMFQLDFMVQALAAAIIIGLLLSYLGVHVVRRGIVFVDLALGQISSLGVAFSDYIGYGKTVIPVLFALIGALLMSLIHIRDKRLKLEAIIGIIYGVASAATVLLISKTPHGDSDIQEVLFGNILAVTLSQILIIGIVFGILTLMHLFFYRKFLALTVQYESGIFNKNVIFNVWNFLFYISIGLAIVFAVRICGVIPVFAYLIIPSVCGIMLSHGDKKVIIIAILISVLGGYLCLVLSFQYDFPAGSSIVAVLGGMFVIVVLLKLVRSIRGEKKYQQSDM